MLTHACPGCGRVVPYGKPLCPSCQARRDERLEQRRRDYAREYEARKGRPDDPKYREFYRSREWRALAAATLAGCGFRCENDGAPGHPRCRHVACEVHHEPPIRTDEGWAHRLDPAHLHPLCTECHNERHRRFQGRAARARGGADPGGWPKKFWVSRG